ncbi:hypothetical protein NHJ6243_009208 [Beauveria neobassiana]
MDILFFRMFLPLSMPFGTASYAKAQAAALVSYLFNSGNYSLAFPEHVLDAVTHLLGQALRENLWAPLGMKATYFDVCDALAAQQKLLAASHVWTEAAGNYILVDHMAVTNFDAAGPITSIFKVYVKWICCLINKQEYTTVRNAYLGT